MINLKEQNDQYYLDRKNIANLRNNINSNSINSRIMKHCQKFGRNFKKIKNKILVDDNFADLFIPVLAKQNFFELETFRYLHDDLHYPIHKMAPNGKEALYLSGGRIVSNPTINSTKSFDYKLMEKRSTTFISQKYINEGGGSQDNQFNDIKYFLIQANKYFNADRGDLFKSNIKFMAIVDGEYFTKDKMNILNTLKRKNKIMVNHINDM